MQMVLGGKKFAATNVAVLNDYKKEEYFGGRYELIPSSYSKISVELLPIDDIKAFAGDKEGEEKSWCILERILIEVVLPSKCVMDFISGEKEISID